MSDEELNQLLADLAQGDTAALDALLPLVYEDLSEVARAQLRRLGGAHTLNTKSLVHEAYLRLCQQRRIEVNDRRHFLAVAAIVMRRLVANYARDKNSQKRGGGLRSLTLDNNTPAVIADKAEDLLALDIALDQLQLQNDRAARVVECRYFAGYSVDETAEALGISSATVKRDWNMARAWLSRELNSG